MEFPLSQLASILPVEIDFLSTLKFVGIFAAVSIVLSLFGRVVFGKRSALNHAVSSSMGILFIYVVTVAIYTFNPSGLSRILSPLPFVQLTEEYLYILPFHEAGITAVCENLLSLLILAFLVNVLDGFIPKGKSLAGWYLLRFLTVALAILLHYAVNCLTHRFLPGVLVTYAPIILVAALFILLILGVLNFLLGLVLTVVNPIFGAIYAFFFSNALGKQLSKSILTTAIICGVFMTLERFGYTAICISAAALLSYLPLLIVLLILWYLIGHLL